MDGATNALSIIPVGITPYTIAINPVTNKISVANRNSASVTIIDGGTNVTTTLAVGMQPKLTRFDTFFFASLENEAPRQRGGLSMRQKPANNVAAVDVEDDVQVVIVPPVRTEQLRDVPGPNLVRCCGAQLGFRIVRMSKLIASFPQAATLPQNAVHRTHGALIAPLIK
jgi:hypothetical protein